MKKIGNIIRVLQIGSAKLLEFRALGCTNPLCSVIFLAKILSVYCVGQVDLLSNHWTIDCFIACNCMAGRVKLKVTKLVLNNQVRLELF